MSVHVLDSWPVLEWIKGRQPASNLFHALIVRIVTRDAAFAMSRINYGEVIYSIRKAPEVQNADAALALFYSLPIDLYSVDDDLVDAAPDLKSTYSISYADAFAAALAIRLDSPVVTGDHEFRTLETDGLLRLHWLGA